MFGITARTALMGYAFYGTPGYLNASYPWAEHFDYNKSDVANYRIKRKDWILGRVYYLPVNGYRLPSIRLYTGECLNGKKLLVTDYLHRKKEDMFL